MIDANDNSTIDMLGGNAGAQNHSAIDSELQDLQSLIRDVIQKSYTSPEVLQRSREMFQAALREMSEMEY